MGVGEVRIIVEAFDFSPQPSLVEKSPLTPKGVARAVALLTIKLRALRGLTKEKDTGAVMRFIIGDNRIESKASQYVEMMQDLVYNTKTQWIDPAVQRLAEYLSAERKYSPEEIAEIAGVDAESLKLILKQRPSFTTRWHQGFNILVLDDINSASIQMELVIPGEDDKTSFVSMDRPIMLKDLLAKGNMSIDDVQSLHRVHHVEPAQGTMPRLTRRLSTMAGSTFCGNGNNQNIEDAGLLDEKPSISHMPGRSPFVRALLMWTSNLGYGA